MDYGTSKRLSYERFKSEVMSFLSKERDAYNNKGINFHYNKIRPNKLGSVCTMSIRKNWKPLITKGIVRSNGHVIPYGYPIL